MYDWENRNWEDEDKEFAPKRRVNNKGADKKPHIIGSFYSSKMQRIIEFESLNEEILFELLEMDNATIRYYVQPVRIGVGYLGEKGERKTWMHISDVLVFRQGFQPHLFQIKDILDNESEKLKICNINEACVSYAVKHNWEYSVVRPKQIQPGVLHNIKFLAGFIKKRYMYDELIPKLILKLSSVRESTISDLSKSFNSEVDPQYCLPVIYHLIATGAFKIDINIPINSYSATTIASQESILSNTYIGGMICEMGYY